MKMRLLTLENSRHVGNASEADWRRDGFGPAAKFTALVAEIDDIVVGMAIYSKRAFPGWSGTAFFLHDLYVEEDHRGCGCARALMERVAAEATALNAAFIELTVDANNSAREFYRRLGFTHVSHCMAYVATQPAVRQLAGAAKAKPRRYPRLQQAS